jgi:hypothetical protein
MPGEEICTIINKHVEDCGEPPLFDFDDFSYVSYFENEHGEQSLFLYDSDEDEIIVYVADADWENPQILKGQWVLDNELPSEDEDVGILLSSNEKLWLKACKNAIRPKIKYNQPSDGDPD